MSVVPLSAATSTAVAVSSTMIRQDEETKTAAERNDLDSYDLIQKSVGNDAQSRCTIGWDPNKIITQLNETPTMPAWLPYITNRFEALSFGIANSVWAVYDHWNRDLYCREVRQKCYGGELESCKIARPLEVFPYGKLPPNTIGLRRDTVGDYLTPILGPSAVKIIHQYGIGVIVQSSKERGKRQTMEDELSVKLSQNLFSVWDGHGAQKSYGLKHTGGNIEAITCNELFPKHFATHLTEGNGNVHLAFQRAAHHMATMHRNSKSGTVGGVLHIDNDFAAHVMLIGDCSVTIYRKIAGVTKTIQIGIAFDWMNPIEATRAAQAKATIEFTNPDLPIPGYILCHRDAKDLGIGPSRAFGDREHATGVNGNPLVITEPTISTYPFLQPDDVIVVASDGKECLPGNDGRVIELIDSGVPNLAKAITKEAAAEEESDNVSAIAVKVVAY